MPELPELEVISEVMSRRLAGRPIQRVSIEPKGGPTVVRDLTGRGFEQTLGGVVIKKVYRRGKFLVVPLQPDMGYLAVNFKLAGRFQLCHPDEKKAGPVLLTLHFRDPEESLRYIDRKKMGQLYLTDDLSLVPTFSEMGPDALLITQEAFQQRMRSFRGEIKGILTREKFVSGIGNAYADEILWQARIHPYRKRPSLTPDEVNQLFKAMHKVLSHAIDEVRGAMGEAIHLKPRDFFSVHMRGGSPCPRCETTIASITAGKRITNFCRNCQPGGLIRGM